MDLAEAGGDNPQRIGWMKMNTATVTQQEEVARGNLEPGRFSIAFLACRLTFQIRKLVDVPLENYPGDVSSSIGASAKKIFLFWKK